MLTIPPLLRNFDIGTVWRILFQQYGEEISTSLIFTTLLGLFLHILSARISFLSLSASLSLFPPPSTIHVLDGHGGLLNPEEAGSACALLSRPFKRWRNRSRLHRRCNPIGEIVSLIATQPWIARLSCLVRRSIARSFGNFRPFVAEASAAAKGGGFFSSSGERELSFDERRRTLSTTGWPCTLERWDEEEWERYWDKRQIGKKWREILSRQ